MKTLKRLALGAAVLALPLATASLAQAADAPRYAAKGKEPVYRCDDKGFIEYPGSDTCFKIGGAVYAFLGFHEDQADDSEQFDPFRIRNGVHTLNDTFWMGSKANINVDVRQATEHGIVRVFIEMTTKDNNTNDGGTLDLKHGFIQFGNLLFGKTSTTFKFGKTPETFNESLSKFPGEQDNRINQVRYTASLGNGVTIAVAIEDPARLEQSAGNYAAVGLAPSRNEAPDLVFAISAKGSWGQAQLSASAHQSSYLIGAASDRRWGWAGQFGVVLDVPGMNGDAVYLQASYASGHSSALVLGTGLSVGLTALGTVDPVEGWAVIGGYRHVWSEMLRSTLGAAYSDIDYNAVVVAPTTLDKTTVVWANLIWSPVKSLDLGVEVYWGRTELLNGVKASGMGASAQAAKTF